MEKFAGYIPQLHASIAHASCSSMAHIVMDVTSSACWSGPAVGIIRAETEFAKWAVEHGKATCVVFDPARQNFRRVKTEWLTRLLDGSAALDSWGMPTVDPQRPRKSDRIPGFLRPAYRWLNLRRKLLSILEAARLNKGRFAAGAAAIQPWLMSEKYRRRMVMPSGERRDLPSFDIALDQEVQLERSVFVSAGSAWANLNLNTLQMLKQASGCKIVTLCYDIIPLQFPQWYEAHDVEAFRAYFHRAFPLSDLVAFSAEQIERDVRAYCQRHSISLSQTAVVPLGSDFSRHSEEAAPLPAALVAGRYILFVSTIEPRKGHELLYKIWARLAENGLLDQMQYKLVFVGRWGWKIDALKSALLDDPRVRNNILVMSNVPDRTLNALYQQSAFCVYPSLYEGFGLPVIEAFSHGKAVVSSNGGALKEVVGDFSPAIDPNDFEAWYSKIMQWITDPQEREQYERRIQQEYKPRSWGTAASEFFDKAAAVSG